MPTVKRAYRVLPKHREEVAGVEVVTGQIIYLTDAEALYERDLGYIEPVDATAAPPPPSPFVATDTIILSRGGATRVILASELAAFFAPALGSTPVDTTQPIILTPPTLSTPEKVDFTVTLEASEAVTWAKVGGADESLFTLSGATMSLAAKDYGAPTDAEADNTYVVQVTATDAAGNVSAPKVLSVAVTNVVELPGGSGGGSLDFSDAANSGLIAALAA